MGIARACFRGLAECVLFLFSILQALAGAAFVTFSILLANPPSSGIALYAVLPGLCAHTLTRCEYTICTPPPHRALVIFGSVMLGAAVFGMLTSSCPRQCCLVFYILIGIALTIVQLIIVLVMIIDPQKVINNLISSCQTVGNCQGITSNAQRVNDLVYTGRWVLLGWVCAQAVCLVLAIMLCTCCKKGRRRYNDFDEDPEVAAARERLRAVQMQNMAMEQGAAGNTNGVSRKNLNGAKSTPLSSQDYNKYGVCSTRTFLASVVADVPSPPLNPQYCSRHCSSLQLATPKL